MRTIGRYEIIDVIGTGSMGRVLKGRHPDDGRLVAIKTVYRQLLEEPDVLRRFLREAEVLSTLRHPNIVSILDAGEHDASPYIVMEFCDGCDLGALIAAKYRLSYPQIANLLMQAAAGLDYAHLHRVIHRDIKPANLILLKNGILKIVDFGVARLAEGSGFTRTGVALGTPAYMSPEQAQGLKVDTRTDQFSLGVVAYELLHGHNPFEADNYSAILFRLTTHQPLDLPDLLPGRLRPLAAATMRLLHKEREKRFPTVAEYARTCYDLVMSAPTDESGLDTVVDRLAVHCRERREASRSAAPPPTPPPPEVPPPPPPPPAPTVSGPDTAGPVTPASVADTWHPPDATPQPGEAPVPGLLHEARQALRAGDLDKARQYLDLSESQHTDTYADDIAAFREEYEQLLANKKSYEASAALRQILADAWNMLDSDRIENAEEKLRQIRAIDVAGMQEEVAALERRIRERKMPPGTLVGTTLSLGRGLDVSTRSVLPEGTAGVPDPTPAAPSTVPTPPRKPLTNPLGMTFLFILPGEFMMGDRFGGSDEKPRHQVVITEGFYLQTTPVTQKQWVRVMEDNPAEFRDESRPVERVSWDDAQEFIRRLNRQGNIVYGLPTEAEWEYACRAGTEAAYFWGDDMDDRFCWYDENSGNRSQPVGTREPNPWGFYDMLGNVWEWCLDWYDGGWYKKSPVQDPEGPQYGEQRVVRGGSWFGSAFIARCGNRGAHHPQHRSNNLGFRLIISPRRNR